MKAEQKRRLKQQGMTDEQIEVLERASLDPAEVEYYRRRDRGWTPPRSNDAALHGAGQSINWHNRYHALLHDHPEKGLTVLPHKMDYAFLENARLQSAAEPNKLVILAPQGVSGADHIFSNRLGIWNVSMMLRFCEAADPLFGPVQYQLSPQWIKSVIDTSDPDPRYIKAMGGTYDTADLARPIMMIMDPWGHLFHVDGTHRMINLFNEGFRTINTYIVPATIADCFRMFYFLNGSERDYEQENLESHGRYRDRDGNLHIEGASPSELAAAQERADANAAEIYSLMEEANRKGKAER